jgi:hypothetical protein
MLETQAWEFLCNSTHGESRFGGAKKEKERKPHLIGVANVGVGKNEIDKIRCYRVVCLGGVNQRESIGNRVTMVLSSLAYVC